MTQAKNSTSQLVVSLSRRMKIGGSIGILLFLFLLSTVKQSNPEWGQFWMLRPMIVLAFAGAMGGLCNYFIMYYHSQYNINRFVAMFISVLVFIVGLWMGIVLGFNGTLWN